MDVSGLERIKVTKSCEDKRDYVGYILPNKLKAVLISDPTTEKAAAAVDVHVGKTSFIMTMTGGLF